MSPAEPAGQTGSSREETQDLQREEHTVSFWGTGSGLFAVSVEMCLIFV